jgi:hypothetical protein
MIATMQRLPLCSSLPYKHSSNLPCVAQLLQTIYPGSLLVVLFVTHAVKVQERVLKHQRQHMTGTY